MMLNYDVWVHLFVFLSFCQREEKFDFLFVSVVPEMGLPLKERIYYDGSKLFPLRVDPEVTIKGDCGEVVFLQDQMSVY